MPWFGEWLQTLSAGGIPVAAWLLAAARVLPTTLLVPAFGLLAFPAPVRVIWALVLSAASLPAASWLADQAALDRGATTLDATFALQLLHEALVGLPVGIGAAVLVWTSLMLGGIVDQLQGLRLQYGVVQVGAGPFASLFALAAAYGFLRFDGVPWVMQRLFADGVSGTGFVELLLQSSRQIVTSVGLAVAIAAPLLVLSAVMDLALLTLNRVAGGVGSLGNLAAVRSLLSLVLIYLLLPRIGQALALAFDFSTP